MSRLADLEQLFWLAVRHQPAPLEASKAFVSRGQLSAEHRLEIYRSAFWVRQVGALREAFPSLVAHLGDGPFAQLASRYLRQHPSRSWALEHLGRALPGYLEAQDEPVLAQLAALEQARLDVLISPDCDRIDASALDPARAEETEVMVGAQVTTVELGLEALALLPLLWRRAAAEEPVLAVWRERHFVQQRWVSRSEAAAVQAARHGVTLTALCTTLAEADATAAGAHRAYAKLKRWFDLGWVSALSPRRVLVALLVGVLGLGLDGCGSPQPPLTECEIPNTAMLAAAEQTGPTMRPGSNCLRCHVAGGLATAKPFSVGGTVFGDSNSHACDGVEGVGIRVTDSAGKTIELVSNAVGNFYSDEVLEPPLRMEARFEGRTMVMPVTAPTGGCALCHSWPDPVEAAGRIRAP